MNPDKSEKRNDNERAEQLEKHIERMRKLLDNPEVEEAMRVTSAIIYYRSIEPKELSEEVREKFRKELVERSKKVLIDMEKNEDSNSKENKG